MKKTFKSQKLILIVACIAFLFNNCKKSDDNNPANGKSTAVFNPTLTYGTMTDQDGNVYKTITIGTQTWMAENLRTSRYRNGDAIPNVTDNSAWSVLKTGAYSNYNNTNSIDSIATFGRLYNLYAVTDSRNLAPVGWHVASNDEWTSFSQYLITNGYSYSGSGNGIAKSMSSASSWTASSTTGTPGNDMASNNRCGFTALAGGFRSSNGKFQGIAKFGDWWPSSLRFWEIAYDYSQLYTSPNAQKEDGHSVRCVKDI